ncbi:MAG TPA: MOSC domain-containing protein [Streptosporangiaceae bacterium]|nr:MOSC domain-containing protein [Streptosporangiaceae bacterium]
MPNVHVVSVNVGMGKDADWAGRLKRTAIDKRPVTGPVAVGTLGLGGDEQVDQDHHGGPEQAVYVYAREDLDWWVEQLQRDLPHGAFGENVTTGGLDVTGALIGEVWQLGTALVQVTSPRIPCGVFAAWAGEGQWVKRFAAARRPGAYLRVLAEGEVRAGDSMAVVERPAERVTIAEAMGANYGDTDTLLRMLRIEGHNTRWDGLGAGLLGSVPLAGA